jgi:hypothetical protein
LCFRERVFKRQPVTRIKQRIRLATVRTPQARSARGRSVQERCA